MIKLFGMKTSIEKYRYTLFIIAVGVILSIVSCKKDDDSTTAETNTSSTNTELTPTEEVTSLGLKKIQEFTKGNYTFYLYRKTSAALVTGYNEIYVQVKNNTAGTYVQDASLSWYPLMHMTSASHSTPYSAIAKVQNTKTLYKGYIIFIMAGPDTATEYWQLAVNYTSGTDTLAKASSKLYVAASTYKTLNSFKSTLDSQKYFIALVEPTSPVVGANTITAYVYKMVSMTSFTPVQNYSILIDPRMPDMNNHSSTKNVNLTYDATSSIYKGTVNFSMTGYWKLNLILLNASNETLGGSAVTDTNTASNVYFEFAL
jgi:hypothetical protein